MKFTSFKEFVGINSNDLMSYAKNELSSFFRYLSLGLEKLTFLDNFDSFKVAVTIAAGAEVPVRNQLRTKEIPTQWVIVDATGTNAIVRGDSLWTIDYLYLKNIGGVSATVNVIFFK